MPRGKPLLSPVACTLIAILCRSCAFAGRLLTAPTYPAGTSPYSVAIGDFNGDGKMDLAVADSEDGQTGRVNILLGNGDGTFQPFVSYAAEAGTTFVVSGDFNGDGKLDLAVTNLYGNSVSVLLGNGDGTF